jgi:hypothetical protein
MRSTRASETTPALGREPVAAHKAIDGKATPIYSRSICSTGFGLGSVLRGDGETAQNFTSAGDKGRAPTTSDTRQRADGALWFISHAR